MKLTPAQFQARYQNNELALSLIGMANIGKSFWTKRLAKQNFQRICCDDSIEGKIEPELRAMGYAGLADMAKWLGHPFEPQFPANQERYLDLEKAVMDEIFARLADPKKSNIAIDTTGSVIYTGEGRMEQLKRHTLIVYIEAPAAMKEALFQKFLEHPKPIVWGASYQPDPDENELDALKRCYPALLNFRTRRYRAIADVILPYAFLDYEVTGAELLNRIAEYL